MPNDHARVLPTLDEFDLSGRRVLVRSDLNVLLADGSVTAAARTIAEALDKGGLALVISHLGRPKGARDPSLSLRAVAEPVGSALDCAAVRFAEDCAGDDAEAPVDGARPGEGTVVLLEHVRFHSGAKNNDPGLADPLVRLGDAYVDDALSAAHRPQASIAGLVELCAQAIAVVWNGPVGAAERDDFARPRAGSPTPSPSAPPPVTSRAWSGEKPPSRPCRGWGMRPTARTRPFPGRLPELAGECADTGRRRARKQSPHGLIRKPGRSRASHEHERRLQAWQPASPSTGLDGSAALP